MKKWQNPRTKAILIFTFCLLFCLALEGGAADEIQLRKYPALDGPVLDDEIAPEPEKKIEIVKELPFQKTGSKKENPKVQTVSKSNAGAGSISIGPMSIQTANHPVKKKEVFIKTSEPSIIPETPAKKNENNIDTSKIPEPSEPIHKNRATLTQPSKPAVNTAPAAKKPHDGRMVHTLQDNERPPVKPARTTLPKNTAIPSPKGRELWNGSAMLPSTAPASNNNVNPPIIKNSGESPPRKVEKIPKQPLITAFLDMGLRLLTMLMSCLAIVFACKAKKMADMSCTLTLQLQQHMDMNRGREFDERY